MFCSVLTNGLLNLRFDLIWLQTNDLWIMSRRVYDLDALIRGTVQVYYLRTVPIEVNIESVEFPFISLNF